MPSFLKPTLLSSLISKTGRKGFIHPTKLNDFHSGGLKIQPQTFNISLHDKISKTKCDSQSFFNEESKLPSIHIPFQCLQKTRNIISSVKKNLFKNYIICNKKAFSFKKNLLLISWYVNCAQKKKALHYEILVQKFQNARIFKFPH